MTAPLQFVRVNVFHVKQVLETAADHGLKAGAPEGLLRAWCNGPAGATLLSGGVPVACGGLFDEGWQNARAWLLVSRSMPHRAWPMVVNRLAEGMDEALLGWARRVQAETRGLCPRQPRRAAPAGAPGGDDRLGRTLPVGGQPGPAGALDHRTRRRLEGRLDVDGDRPGCPTGH
jgi:hypothetical protein